MRAGSSSMSSSMPLASSLSLSTLLFLIPSLSTALGIDCRDIAAQGKHFDLGKLDGDHKLHWKPTSANPNLISSITWDLNICAPLKRDKGVKKDEFCRQGTYICGTDSETGADGNTTVSYLPIAGLYKFSGDGRTLEPKFTLLRGSGSNADADREGFRAELHGGRVPADDPKGKNQKAIIEFVCDPKKTGLEGDELDDGEKEPDDGDVGNPDEKKLMRRDDNCYDSDSKRSLKFCSYKPETVKDEEFDVLRLQWTTKYACEDYEDEDGAGSHWGFFTWFVIILFLATAAYLIFGSWLNYNRYGARGWDLLPHGDTIRDIPYVLKDLGRRVVNGVQGPGSRGGYSAV